MTIHKLKASDISDDVVMAAIHDQIAAQGFSCRGGVRDRLSLYPKKVVNAKLRSMALRGVISTCDSPGCTCASLIDVPITPSWATLSGRGGT